MARITVQRKSRVVVSAKIGDTIIERAELARLLVALGGDIQVVNGVPTLMEREDIESLPRALGGRRR